MNPKKWLLMSHGFPISKGSQGDAYRAGLQAVEAHNAGTTSPDAQPDVDKRGVIEGRINRHISLLEKLQAGERQSE